MEKFTLKINGHRQPVNAEKDKPLLWVIRENVRLTGTKYGCGLGQCGACTVLIDNQPARSCLHSAYSIRHQKITTLEGLQDSLATQLREAWKSIQVPQCGYCTAGQFLTAYSVLKQSPCPQHADIIQAMDPLLCRCGTYQRIIDAIELVSQQRTCRA